MVMKWKDKLTCLIRNRKRIFWAVLSAIFLYNNLFRLLSFCNNLNSNGKYVLDHFDDHHELLKYDRTFFNGEKPNKIEEIRREQICPENPPDLLGKIPPKYDDLNSPEWSEIAKANPNLSEGGFYSPASCKARHRVAIIIPLRGRKVQLRAFLSHMHPVWQRQQIEYTVYTVTQTGNTLFNRAKLMNVGFVEASKDRKYDCYVFHDVDLMLENDKCLYWCSENNPRQLAKYINVFDYEEIKYWLTCPSLSLLFKTIYGFGGASMMSRQQFDDVNGYSNLYWGWGGEDDDMYLRLWKKGYSITNPYHDVCRFRMIEHVHESTNSRNKGRQALLYHAYSRMENEGLSTLRYKVLSLERELLYTNLTVEIGEPNRKLKKFVTRRSFVGEKCSERMPWN